MIGPIFVLVIIALVGLAVGAWRGQAFSRLRVWLLAATVVALITILLAFPRFAFGPLVLAVICCAQLLCGFAGPAFLKMRASAIAFSLGSATLVGSGAILIALMTAGI